MGTFLFIVIVGIAAVIAIVVHNKKVNESWSNAAAKLRLTYSDQTGGRRIEGQRAGIYLEAKPELVGRATWTSFRAEFPESLPFPIRLKPQTFLSNLGNTVLNRIDLETGDLQFDSKVIVESSDPDQARRFLNERARGILMKLISRFDELEMNTNSVTVKRGRLVSKVDDLVEDVRVLENSIRDLWESAIPKETNKPSPPPLPTKTESREAKDKDEAVAIESEKESEPSVVAPPETGVIEEALNQREAESIDVEIVEDKKPENVETHSGPADDAGEALFAYHCREVLSECQGRYAMKKQFETELQGTEVAENFLLESEEPYSMHRIYGRGPGTLRTFSLGNLPDGNELLLVADTANGMTRDPLDPRSGESDVVDGRLISFDPFTYTLFLRSHSEEDENADQ